MLNKLTLATYFIALQLIKHSIAIKNFFLQNVVRQDHDCSTGKHFSKHFHNKGNNSLKGCRFLIFGLPVFFLV